MIQLVSVSGLLLALAGFIFVMLGLEWERKLRRSVLFQLLGIVIISVVAHSIFLGVPDSWLVGLIFGLRLALLLTLLAIATMGFPLELLFEDFSTLPQGNWSGSRWFRRQLAALHFTMAFVPVYVSELKRLRTVQQVRFPNATWRQSHLLLVPSLVMVLHKARDLSMTLKLKGYDPGASLTPLIEGSAFSGFGFAVSAFFVSGLLFWMLRT